MFVTFFTDPAKKIVSRKEPPMAKEVKEKKGEKDEKELDEEQEEDLVDFEPTAKFVFKAPTKQVSNSQKNITQFVFTYYVTFRALCIFFTSDQQSS